MADFTMQHYWNKYQDAVIKSGRLRTQVEGLKSALAAGAGGEDLLEELQSVEEEYKAAQVEADDLYCLATTGKHRAELNQGAGIRYAKQYGGYKPHFPETPRGGKLPH